jgi:hypothetical protein
MALTAAVISAGLTAPAGAQSSVTITLPDAYVSLASPEEGRQMKVRRQAPRQIEYNADKLPTGSNIWWQQMDRESRGGRRWRLHVPDDKVFGSRSRAPIMPLPAKSPRAIGFTPEWGRTREGRGIARKISRVAAQDVALSSRANFWKTPSSRSLAMQRNTSSPFQPRLSRNTFEVWSGSNERRPAHHTSEKDRAAAEALEHDAPWLEMIAYREVEYDPATRIITQWVSGNHPVCASLNEARYASLCDQRQSQISKSR